jgi:hypothetical protein
MLKIIVRSALNLAQKSQEGNKSAEDDPRLFLVEEAVLICISIFIWILVLAHSQ